MGYAVVFSKEAKKQINQLRKYLSLRFYQAHVERYIESLVDA